MGHIIFFIMITQTLHRRMVKWDLISVCHPKITEHIITYTAATLAAK